LKKILLRKIFKINIHTYLIFESVSIIKS